MPKERTASAPPLPKINQQLMGGFRVFNRMYLRKHFHVVGIHWESLKNIALTGQEAIVVYANHASWWDPLVAIFLADKLFPNFRMYAPIDASAFEKYRIFGQMGFYPIDTGSLRGAGAFLKTSRNILSMPGGSIWITPEGRFADARDHTAEFMPGLAHLAASLSGQNATAESGALSNRPPVSRVWFLSLALEYSFWEERTPEILGRFGEPICVENSGRHSGTNATKAEWDSSFRDSLRTAQTELAQTIVARDDTQFEILLKNKSGSFVIYDWFRKARSKLSGTKLELDHSTKFAGSGKGK